MLPELGTQLTALLGRSLQSRRRHLDFHYLRRAVKSLSNLGQDPLVGVLERLHVDRLLKDDFRLKSDRRGHSVRSAIRDNTLTRSVRRVFDVIVALARGVVSVATIFL